MRVVRRFTQSSGGRPTPAVPAELLTLMDKLAGPPDVWDRPDGDFGPLSDLYELDVEARQGANSLYRLGSRALERSELSAAADLLGSAAAAGHPGALFRLAVVALRSGKEWTDDAWFFVAEAARHGHGDAQRLLTASAGRRPLPGGAPLVEDISFFEEVCHLLGVDTVPLQSVPLGLHLLPGGGPLRQTSATRRTPTARRPRPDPPSSRPTVTGPYRTPTTPTSPEAGAPDRNAGGRAG
ncbi:hypothetical protein M2160_000022 [Streptomyces sp. SAI-117]|nr:hypothetical protein [Streptomyces sp. SAI-117]